MDINGPMKPKWHHEEQVRVPEKAREDQVATIPREPHFMLGEIKKPVHIKGHEHPSSFNIIGKSVANSLSC